MKIDNDTVCIGHSHGWGGDILAVLKLAERRQHVYVIGQTGTGKSTLLRNLILQDIEAGRGVGLVDPHGDLARDILDHIPAWRTDDVVYFDPTSSAPLAINLFRATKDNWHLTAAGIVSTFKKTWGDSWGPRLEYILFATVAALIHCDNSSLLGVSRMLHDARYRAWVVRQIKDPMVRSFWVNEFGAYDPRFLQEVISPVQNKIGQLFFAPPIRLTLGQVASKVNFRFMMDHRRIFIANLCKGYLGEAHSSLLGSLLVTGFEIAALSRADCPADAREDFFLYVDEFQNCATDSFASILSEARKYRLCLTLAHQYVGQLDEETSKAVFGNVGSLISFRVGEADASTLERQFGGAYTASQFAGLQNYELCAKFLNGEPFLGVSLPPLQTERRRREAVIKRSREKYGTEQSIVEAKIDRWLRRKH
jgi:TraM recognition site of TraD and TraG/Helicase HerA, central domain